MFWTNKSKRLQCQMTFNSSPFIPLILSLENAFFAEEFLVQICSNETKQSTHRVSGLLNWHLYIPVNLNCSRLVHWYWQCTTFYKYFTIIKSTNTFQTFMIFTLTQFYFTKRGTFHPWPSRLISGETHLACDKALSKGLRLWLAFSTKCFLLDLPLTQ